MKNNEAKQELKQAQIRFLLDEALSCELDQVDEALCSAVSDGAPDLHPTAENLMRMQHRLDRLFRRRLKMRRIAILIVAVMILSTAVVGALCAPAIRQLFLVNTDTHTEITLADYPANDWEDAYIPTIFPGEQSRPSVQVTKTQRTLTYHVDQKVLVFYQYRGDTTAGFDTENTEPAEPVQIGSITGWIADKNGERYLYWMQDGYMFALLGHFSDNEIIATAESVQPQNNQRSE